MLKKEKYIYECEEFKIINPDRELTQEIVQEMGKFVKEDGEIDIENDDFKLYLLQTLVDTENEDYLFLGMTLDDIKDIEENPSFEYETIPQPNTSDAPGISVILFAIRPPVQLSAVARVRSFSFKSATSIRMLRSFE